MYILLLICLYRNRLTKRDLVSGSSATRTGKMGGLHFTIRKGNSLRINCLNKLLWTEDWERHVKVKMLGRRTFLFSFAGCKASWNVWPHLLEERDGRSPVPRICFYGWCFAQVLMLLCGQPPRFSPFFPLYLQPSSIQHDSTSILLNNLIHSWLSPPVCCFKTHDQAPLLTFSILCDSASYTPCHLRCCAVIVSLL